MTGDNFVLGPPIISEDTPLYLILNLLETHPFLARLAYIRGNIVNNAVVSSGIINNHIQINITYFTTSVKISVYKIKTY